MENFLQLEAKEKEERLKRLKEYINSMREREEIKEKYSRYYYQRPDFNSWEYDDEEEEDRYSSKYNRKTFYGPYDTDGFDDEEGNEYMDSDERIKGRYHQYKRYKEYSSHNAKSTNSHDEQSYEEWKEQQQFNDRGRSQKNYYKRRRHQNSDQDGGNWFFVWKKQLQARKLFGLSERATLDEKQVKDIYRKLAMEHHPDRVKVESHDSSDKDLTHKKGIPEDQDELRKKREEDFKEINNAYATLMDEIKQRKEKQ